MALTAYLKVEGNTQKEIKGDCPQGGDKKDRILVFDVKHSVEIPKDTHTGLPSGQRIHHPLVITKKLDNATPKLYQMCCTGEQGTITLDHYRIKDSGEEEKYFTIKLENAIIVQIDKDTPTTFLEANKPYSDMEKLYFTYSKITWIYNDGNIEFTDDWKK